MFFCIKDKMISLNSVVTWKNFVSHVVQSYLDKATVHTSRCLAISSFSFLADSGLMKTNIYSDVFMLRPSSEPARSLTIETKIAYFRAEITNNSEHYFYRHIFNSNKIVRRLCTHDLRQRRVSIHFKIRDFLWGL